MSKKIPETKKELAIALEHLNTQAQAEAIEYKEKIPQNEV